MTTSAGFISLPAPIVLDAAVKQRDLVLKRRAHCIEREVQETREFYERANATLIARILVLGKIMKAANDEIEHACQTSRNIAERVTLVGVISKLDDIIANAEIATGWGDGKMFLPFETVKLLGIE